MKKDIQVTVHWQGNCEVWIIKINTQHIKIYNN